MDRFESRSVYELGREGRACEGKMAGAGQRGSSAERPRGFGSVSDVREKWTARAAGRAQSERRRDRCRPAPVPATARSTGTERCKRRHAHAHTRLGEGCVTDPDTSANRTASAPELGEGNWSAREGNFGEL